MLNATLAYLAYLGLIVLGIIVLSTGVIDILFALRALSRE